MGVFLGKHGSGAHAKVDYILDICRTKCFYLFAHARFFLLVITAPVTRAVAIRCSTLMAVVELNGRMNGMLKAIFIT